MDSKQYMVRVACRTFNQAFFIKDALDGFCMQKTTFPFVCTIFDDASQDGESQIIKAYIAEHFDINNTDVCRQEETDDYLLTFAQHATNKNCFFCFFLLKYNHFTIKKALRPYMEEWYDNSKYTAFCEGDDYWTDPFKLQKQIDFLESHPEYGMCHTDFFTSGRRHITPVKLEENDIYWPSILTKGLRIGTVTVVVRTDVYLKIPRLYVGKGWPIGDLPIWYEIARVSKIKYIPEITATYRIIQESVSHSDDFDKVLLYEEKKLEMKRFYADTYNVEVDEGVWKKQSYEIIIRYAARTKKINLAKKYYLEARKNNILTQKMKIFYYAAKCKIMNWGLRKIKVM